MTRRYIMNPISSAGQQEWHHLAWRKANVVKGIGNVLFKRCRLWMQDLEWELNISYLGGTGNCRQPDITGDAAERQAGWVDMVDDLGGPVIADVRKLPGTRHSGERGRWCVVRRGRQLARGTTARIWAHNRQRETLSNNTGDVHLGCSPARTSVGASPFTFTCGRASKHPGQVHLLRHDLSWSPNDARLALPPPPPPPGGEFCGGLEGLEQMTIRAFTRFHPPPPSSASRCPPTARTTLVTTATSAIAHVSTPPPSSPPHRPSTAPTTPVTTDTAPAAPRSLAAPAIGKALAKSTRVVDPRPLASSKWQDPCFLKEQEKLKADPTVQRLMGYEKDAAPSSPFICPSSSTNAQAVKGLDSVKADIDALTAQNGIVLTIMLVLSKNHFAKKTLKHRVIS
ncbi:hypothetical protein B0H15DRAFT_806600 [Mycena belliarum]|uniref:Uncharacterized protein n=1 Tax=Mycena belliarum TaxID=1033014 RepID=A0AAD6TT43_9AGAR|nr:hypothetical protein B0H15DRAFT_806600 [Mycena belliae]